MISIIVIYFSCFSALIALGVQLEMKAWNNGICKKCGGKWRQFDTDSQGGRGYKCDGGHYEWISYPVDKAAKP